jgi:hypothetical protein
LQLTRSYHRLEQIRNLCIVLSQGQEAVVQAPQYRMVQKAESNTEKKDKTLCKRNRMKVLVFGSTSEGNLLI